MTDPERDQRAADHIWHTHAPRPSGEPTAGKRALAVGFLLLATLVVVLALVLVLGGFVTSDGEVPAR